MENKPQRVLSLEEAQKIRESVTEGVRTIVKPLLEVRTIPLSDLPGMKPGHEWKL